MKMKHSLGKPCILLKTDDDDNDEDDDDTDDVMLMINPSGYLKVICDIVSRGDPRLNICLQWQSNTNLFSIKFPTESL